MRIVIRNFALAVLPLMLGLAAGWGFAYSQESCGRMVGALFASKCHGRMLEYQVLFQTLGTALGCVLTAVLGSWLEHRRRRAVQQTTPTGEPS
jgi:hypothetical protein